MDGGVSGPGLDSLVPALQELGDLKRVDSAGRDGSIATRLFRAAWGALAAGTPADAVCAATVARALAAARQGDLDCVALRAAGLARADVAAVRRAAFEELAAQIPGAGRFRGGLDHGLAAAAPSPFVAALEAQPRAGVACPGMPRRLFPAAEGHAEHCLVTAVYGALLAHP